MSNDEDCGKDSHVFMEADYDIKAERPFNHLEPTCQHSLEPEDHKSDQGKALADIVRNLLAGRGINKCNNQERAENKANINNDVYKTSPHDHYLLCLNSMPHTANTVQLTYDIKTSPSRKRK